ncbi:hypothetical protein IFM89_032225 [Coptis chinensis]|uniref:Uncharacterized protein n=1 Tax=Coptis chinensis TaxID=261450 RepID=A0A835HXR2_9MAGN|nr:hypothetical protein IFM89_032225 [Coptis chinensis]
MIMLPFQHLFNQQQQKQFYDGYGGCGDSFTESFGFMNSLVKGYDCCIGSDLVIGPIMAEDESRTSSVNEAGSSSKDVQEEKKESWLQLGLGAGYMTNPQLSHDHAEPMAQPKRGLLELDLLPAGSSQLHLKPLVPSFHMTEFRAPQQPTSSTSMITSITNVDTPVFLQHPRTSSLNFGQHEVTWGYRPNPWNHSTAVSSSSSSMPPGPFYPPQVPQPSADMAGSSSILRVIDAPRRPHHSNIWFSLQALQNQLSSLGE